MQKKVLKKFKFSSFLASVIIFSGAISAHSFDAENRRMESLNIGGWEEFYFGMPLTKAKAQLKAKCENVTVGGYSIDGLNCGKFNDAPYSISLFKQSDFLWWFDELIKFDIKVSGDQAVLETLLGQAKTSWPNHSEWECSDVLNRCSMMFGNYGRLIISQYSHSPNEIELEYLDLNRFNN